MTMCASPLSEASHDLPADDSDQSVFDATTTAFDPQADRARQRARAVQERRSAKRREADERAALAARYVTIMCSDEIRSADLDVRAEAMTQLIRARIHLRLSGAKVAITTGETPQMVEECIAERAASQAAAAAARTSIQTLTEETAG